MDILVVLKRGVDRKALNEKENDLSGYVPGFLRLKYNSLKYKQINIWAFLSHFGRSRTQTPKTLFWDGLYIALMSP
jgi:hypothetical protein